MGLGSAVSRWLALTWSAITVAYLIVIAAAIFNDPQFHLSVGIIHTVGRMGLIVTILPAALGLVGLILTWRRRALGARLLGIYSAFCGLLFLTVLPSIWNSQASFCTGSFCLRSVWLGRLITFSIASAFFLVAGWAYREQRWQRLTVIV